MDGGKHSGIIVHIHGEVIHTNQSMTPMANVGVPSKNLWILVHWDVTNHQIRLVE